jgi:hypothetical protein
MDSFDVVNTGLVILLALLFFLVRKAVSGGVRDVGGHRGSERGRGRPLRIGGARPSLRHKGDYGEEYLTIKNDISREDDA